MTDRYENTRQALEGLRERCAREAERITARRRAVAAMTNNEAVKPCEVAAAIRKIDVQQYYECAVREIKALRAQLTAAQQPAAVDGAMVERIAALLHEEATAWTVAGVEHPGPDRDYYRGLARKVAALAAMAAQGEDDAWCAECGVKLENVRPGKHQHPICSQAAPQQHAAGVGEER